MALSRFGKKTRETGRVPGGVLSASFDSGVLGPVAMKSPTAFGAVWSSPESESHPAAAAKLASPHRQSSRKLASPPPSPAPHGVLTEASLTPPSPAPHGVLTAVGGGQVVSHGRRQRQLWRRPSCPRCSSRDNTAEPSRDDSRRRCRGQATFFYTAR